MDFNPRFRKYPLRDIRVDMHWLLDSGLHGCVSGEKRSYNMWISVEDNGDPEFIKRTIAHELAHIHAFRYYRKTHGDRIFYSHGKLHRQLERYYMENWMPEINKLYKKLLRATLDVYACDKDELLDLLDEQMSKDILAKALSIC